MRINTNLAALNAWRALSINNNAMTKSLEKLSSGYRVNRAADDAAGLAVSEKMRSQIRGLNMAARNAQDGVSLIQTAEGGAQKIQDMLQRMRELAVQAASDTLDDNDRALLQKEFQELISEVDRTANSTTFNEIALLNGDKSAIRIHIGPGYEVQVTTNDGGTTDPADDTVVDGKDAITLNMRELTTSALGISTAKIDSQTEAVNAIQSLDTALGIVNETRATFGAYQNRLEAAIETLRIQAENLTAAESRIRDVDMALEMANFTKYQILQQASTAMLAQANMSTQSILSLLR